MFNDDGNLRNARSKRASQPSSGKDDREQDAARANVDDVEIVDEYHLGDPIDGGFHAESGGNGLTNGDVRKRTTTIAGNKQSAVNLLNPLSGGPLHQTRRSFHVESGNGLTSGAARKRMSATGNEHVSRMRILTEKGLEYQRGLYDSNRKTTMKAVERKILSLNLLVENVANVNQVQKELMELDHMFSEVIEWHGKYHILIDDYEERDESSRWMNDNDNAVFNIKQYVNKWLESKIVDNFHQEITTERKENYPPCHDDMNVTRQSRVLPKVPRSVASSKASSKQRGRLRSRSDPCERNIQNKDLRSPSRHSCRNSLSSRHSSRQSSSNSSRVSLYTEQKAKVAALKAEAKFVKENQERKDTEEYMLAKEIAKAEAVADVYAEQENKNYSTRRDNRNRSTADSDRESKVGSRQLEDSLTNLLQIQTAPTVDIDKYDGNPLEYNYFMATFKEAVERKIQDPRGRLTRLIQYTKDEAKELIKNCIQEEPAKGYDHAMSLLKEQFGNPHFIARAYISELRKWDTLKVGDAAAFRKFYGFLVKCKTCMSSGTYLTELNTPDILQVLQSKLPYQMQDKWNRLAVKLRQSNGREANFGDFIKIVENETMVANDPMYSREAMNKVTAANKSVPPPAKGGGISTFLIKNEGEGNFSVEPKDKKCQFCNEGHDLDSCTKYLDLDVKARKAFVFKGRLCFSCYSDSHKSQDCKSKRECAVCKGKHPTGLHLSKKTEEPVPVDKETLTNCATDFQGTKDSEISMCIVPVKLWHESTPDKSMMVYAMLDYCSNGTLITEEVINKLGLPEEPATISLRTVNQCTEENATYVDQLVVSAREGFGANGMIKLPRTYSRQQLPIERGDIITPNKVKRWKHLESIVHEIPEFNKDYPIGLLIGGDCPRAIEPHKCVPSVENGPFAFLTKLGWCVSGPMNENPSVEESLKCNRLVVEDISTGRRRDDKFIVQDEIKDTSIGGALKQMYQTEFVENLKENKALSVEDKKFLDIMEKGAEKEGIHHKLPLPFRNEPVNLPNNKVMAEKRTQPLKRKFQKDPLYQEHYTKFMNDLLKKGAATEVTAEKLAEDGPAWYIPHHAVFNKNKPNKFRVVFDCPAKYKDRSLNDELLQGPDLTNLLVGVLLRFRLEEIPIMADIESMFYQVYVKEEHRCFLRFLWWPDGDYTKKLKEYEMCVHVFGAVSSGSCANYALQKTAAENEHKYGHEAAETLRKSFYVDDLLKSAKNSKEGAELCKNVISMCEDGGFNLTKLVSSDTDILQSLPSSKLAPSLQECDLSKGPMPIERALGVLLCLESDEIKFVLLFNDVPLSRRGMLSTISSIYDALGIISPFLLAGRKILQEIVHEKKSWDEEVSDKHRSQWEKWRSKLYLLETIGVRRCIKPKGFGEAVKTTLHTFADASEVGYGVACYVRQVNKSGDVSVSLIMGKSRVSPIGAVSIPRLELTAAVVAAKVSTLTNGELGFSMSDNQFWSDSKIVLGYISNEEKRFRVFVANRSQIIRELTLIQNWHYTHTDDNPADDASRGLEGDDPKVDRWFNGPMKLREAEESWEGAEETFEVREDDPEVKKVIKVHTVSTTHDLLTRLETRISDWCRCVRVLGWMQTFIRRCKVKVRRRRKELKESEDTETRSHLSVADLKVAEESLIRMVQYKYFESELRLLRNFKEEKGRKGEKMRKSVLKKSSSLRKLDPFLDEIGIIRVGGRLRNSVLNNSLKHPVILPRKGKLTTMVIRWVHSQVEHSGRNMTQNELRARGYWVINGNSIIRSLISQCVRCRYLRGQTGEQKMADLPEERTCEAPPFTYCGVDMFGPFLIKERRKELKRYVILFTCLSSRAVHLETCNTMETDSFIQSLRRFIARRGVVRSIRSDNGGNFVGAETELKKALAEMDQEKVRGFLQSQGADWIEWKRNPPAASHMGGVWERQIRSVRAILSSLMKTHGHSLDDESLRTLMAEAEAIVNSRPLTVDGLCDPDSVQPLSPYQILTGKSKVTMGPPGVFQKADVYCRKRWRRVQHIANEFWTRWRREFLLALQKREKWVEFQRNFTVGDVVIIKNEDVRRNQWPLGRVVEVFPDAEGVVRSVKVRTAAKGSAVVGSLLERPIAKLVLLLEAEEDPQGSSVGGE